MGKKNKVVENSAAEIKSSMLNEMDEIGPGIIPDDVKAEAEKESE